MNKNKICCNCKCATLHKTHAYRNMDRCTNAMTHSVMASGILNICAKLFLSGTCWLVDYISFQKTHIIYYWKCPVDNYTAEYIGDTNRSLKERVSDHRNQTTSAIRNHHISTKHPKAELKEFTIIDREGNTLQHWAKEALHIHIKDPSLNRNIGNVRIPSVFNKLLKPSRQLELPHSSIPYPKGVPSSLGLLTQKTINTSHLFDLHLQ